MDAARIRTAKEYLYRIGLLLRGETPKSCISLQSEMLCGSYANRTISRPPDITAQVPFGSMAALGTYAARGMSQPR
jgi:hypothetical protein